MHWCIIMHQWVGMGMGAGWSKIISIQNDRCERTLFYIFKKCSNFVITKMKFDVNMNANHAQKNQTTLCYIYFHRKSKDINTVMLLYEATWFTIGDLNENGRVTEWLIHSLTAQPALPDLEARILSFLVPTAHLMVPAVQWCTVGMPLPSMDASTW